MKKVLFVGSQMYYGGNLVIAEACRVFRMLGYDAEVLVLSNHPKQYVNPILFPFVLIFQNVIYDFLNIVRKLLYVLSPLHKRWKKFKYIAKATDLDGIKVRKCPFFDKENTIVIYPECLYGNPLQAKHIVRWLLFHYQLESDKNAYSDHDFFVAYRGVFNSSRLNPNNYLYTINSFNSKLYRQYNFDEREGNCYILRKGRDREDLPEHFDGPVFDNNMDQLSLIEMFNKYKYCYCYDTQTFYASIAAVCGCIPIVILEPGKTEHDYLSDNEQDHFGIAYGDTPEQIDYAINTRANLLDSLDFTRKNIKQTEIFIDILEGRFGELSKLK